MSIKENTNELINPLPDIIPNIVWDDLLSAQKEKILNAVKSNYTVTYYHTERRHKNDSTVRLVTDTEDTYVNSSSDTDVIEIEEIDSDVKGSRYMCTVSKIYSRATSERGITNIENPVPDIIPCNIWNNLPDVLKEEIVNGASRKNNDSIFINPPPNIRYNPYEDTITIRFHGGFNSHTYIYDAKRGVVIDGIACHGL